MKKTLSFLTILFYINIPLSIQSNPLKKIFVIPTFYVTYKIFQSTDFNKTERLIRQDKDLCCQTLKDIIQDNCSLELCSDVVKFLQQAQSSTIQKRRDILQKDLETAHENISNTINKSSEQLDNIQDNFEKWFHSKKR